MEKIRSDLQSFRVNIDFEKQVALKTTKTLKQKWEREWEYLLWWIEDDYKVLANGRADYYKTSDLDYIGAMTGRSNFFNNSQIDRVQNWWGDPLLPNTIQKTDLPRLRTAIFNDKTTYLGEPINYPTVVKSNGSFSGIGVNFLSNAEEFLLLPKKTYVVEPWRKRIQDFSSYVFRTKTIFYQSHINKNGAYLGSSFFKNTNWLKDSERAIKGVEMIKRYMEDHYNDLEYGIDSYFYENAGELLLESLCEINSRRTLASCVYEIYQKYFSNYSCMQNLILPMKDITKKNEDFFEKNIVRLSPKHGQTFMHFMLLEDSEEGLFRLSSELQKFLYST